MYRHLILKYNLSKKKKKIKREIDETKKQFNSNDIMRKCNFIFAIKNTTKPPKNGSKYFILQNYHLNMKPNAKLFDWYYPFELCLMFF